MKSKIVEAVVEKIKVDCHDSNSVGFSNNSKAEILVTSASSVGIGSNQYPQYGNQYPPYITSTETSFKLDILTMEGKEVIKKILVSLAGKKGESIFILGEMFERNDYILNGGFIKALKLSEELIGSEDISFYETFLTLHKDGFSGTIGELLNIARNI